MNGLPSYDYERDDELADIADSENNARAADAHFTCGHCHQLAKFSELTGYSNCCGWTPEDYVPKRLSDEEAA
jgi:hypothetical protein